MRYNNTGHQARRPQVDCLGDDIYELRVTIDQHQHRLLYFFHSRSIIIVAIGILKNEGRVPPSAIARARKLVRIGWNDLEVRHDG